MVWGKKRYYSGIRNLFDDSQLLSYRTAGKILYTIAPYLPCFPVIHYGMLKAHLILEDDSERADDVAKKNRSDICKGSSQVRRRLNRYESMTPQTNFLFGRCVSCMTLIPLLV